METKYVLVIEDDRDLAQQMLLRLKSGGYRVELASTGNEGLKKARETRPDLILLDLMLPELDGYRLCRLLKFDANYEQIPVIVLTARALDEDKELAAETGANAFFVKPVDWPELHKTIEIFLRHRPDAPAELTASQKAGPEAKG